MTIRLVSNNGPLARMWESKDDIVSSPLPPPDPLVCSYAPLSGDGRTHSQTENAMHQ